MSAVGLDLGTSGVRAALVDSGGEMLALASAAIAPARRRLPEAWWEAAVAAVAGLQADLGDVQYIAVDGTSGTIVPVDAAGAPLAAASLYNDSAESGDRSRVLAASPASSAARGATSPLARALPWRDLPGLAWVLHEADWLAGRMLGRFGVTDWNNALKTGYDPVALAWPDWISALGLRSRLPEAVAPGTALGRLDPRCAAALGLPASAQVVAGTTDGCAAFLATGAQAPGEGVTSLGTTLTIKQLSEAPVFAPQYGIYSHRLGALWLAGGASNSGGAALARHFSPERLAELSQAIDPARQTGLDYYPLPAPGERFPLADPALQPRETPRPADDALFLQGLLEGIAAVEALAYRRLADLGGPPLTGVFTVGGGAANPAWAAIRARVLGVELRAPRSREAAVGVAGLALQAGA